MKNKLFVSLLVVIVALLFVTPVFALGNAQEESGIPLDAVGLFLVGFSTTVLNAFLNLLLDFSVKHKVKIPTWVHQVAVYVVAYGLAFYLAPFAIPSLPVFTADFGLNITLLLNDWVVPLFTVLSAWFVTAHLFYKWFVKQAKINIGSALNIADYSLPKA